MRIVFLSYNYSADINTPAEWVQRIQFYVGWLERLARSHEVIRVDQINYSGEFIQNRVKYYFIEDGKKQNYFPRRLNKFVANLHPDIVVVSSFQFPQQVIQLRAVLGRSVKIIVQHHAEKPFTGIKKWLQKAAGKTINGCIFASTAIASEWIQKGNLPGNIHCLEMTGGSSVFYPLDKNVARQKTNVIGQPVYLWVGRLNHNKDPLLAVETFLKFAEDHPRARLYMLYQTDELLPEIQHLLGSSRTIIPVGKIAHDQLLFWYNSADFYLAASHYEGSGTALCEAMSCGCMPIVTAIPSFTYLGGGNGLLFEPGNAPSLLQVLRQSASVNISEKRKHVLDYFSFELSFEAMAVKFERFVASL